jgi:hypothetical protein
VRKLLQVHSAFRSTRALDEGKPDSVEKDQALVHAALRDAAMSQVDAGTSKQGASSPAGDASSQHAACPASRLRAIMERVQQANPPAPLPWWQARRGVLLAACALFVAGAGLFVHAQTSAQPWHLESMPIVRALWQSKHAGDALATAAPAPLPLTDDAVLAWADAPSLREGERWMSPRPDLAAKREAQLAVAQLREQTQRASDPAMVIALTPDLAQEASVLRAQLDQATQTMLSRLPGQGEPK